MAPIDRVAPIENDADQKHWFAETGVSM